MAKTTKVVTTREMERRFLAREVRAEEREDGSTHIVGYGAVFEEWSPPMYGFRELIEPGAFKKTLQEADIRSLWNHDRNFVLGRNVAGTLELEEDEVGLRYDVTVPNAQWARDLVASIQRGDVDGASFGFDAVKDKWSQEEDSEEVRRRLLEVRLYDVGPVTFPAYPQTSAEARARVEELAAEPSQAGHSGDEAELARAQARLEIRRRRLDLMEVI
jgi:HK97 family phage prohead protease